jgi:hypothetical protein
MACAKKTKIDVKIRLFTRHVFIFFAQAKKKYHFTMKLLATV